MSFSRKHWAIFAIVSIAIIVMAPTETDVVPANSSSRNQQSNNPQSAGSQRPQSVGQVELERLPKVERHSKDKSRVNDVFNTTSWYEAPPQPKNIAPPPPPPPPAPTAPTLPFTYLGRFGDSASRVVILAKGDRVHTVMVGDVIENTYRVEGFKAGMVVLTYLPLNIEQTLQTGDAL